MQKSTVTRPSHPFRTCYRFPLSEPRCGPKTIGAGWSSPVARQAHNLKVVGSNPTPATTFTERAIFSEGGLYFFVSNPKLNHFRDLANDLDFEPIFRWSYGSPLD